MFAPVLRRDKIIAASSQVCKAGFILTTFAWGIVNCGAPAYKWGEAMTPRPTLMCQKLVPPALHLAVEGIPGFSI